MPRLAVALLALVTSVTAATTTPDFSRLETQVQAWRDEGACPAAGLWIVNRAGETVYERYSGTATPATPS